MVVDVYVACGWQRGGLLYTCKAISLRRNTLQFVELLRGPFYPQVYGGRFLLYVGRIPGGKVRGD